MELIELIELIKVKKYDEIFQIKAFDSINKKDSSGLTPLMYAAIDGNVEVIKHLIKLGADIELKDIQNRGAAYYAAINKNDKCLIFLFKGGCGG